MAVTKVTLYFQYDKRKNSTANPRDAVTNGIVVRPLETIGELRENCSILSPRISFRFSPEDVAIEGVPESATVRITRINYAHIPDFGRFYFIANWTHSNGIWIADMTVDVLGTYKDALMLEQNDMYVLRSSSECDELITDMLYPISNEVETVRVTPNVTNGILWDGGANINSGFYVVGIINADSSTYGSVSYYCFTPSGLRTLLNKLMGNFSWLNISEITQELAQALVNPFQYFTSCMWFPSMPSCVSVTSIKYGWWAFSVSAYRITSAIQSNALVATFEVEDHPNSNSKNSYLNTAPFRTVSCTFEPFGSFEMPTPPGVNNISCFADIDYITGLATLKMCRQLEIVNGIPSYDVLAYRQGRVGVPIQLSQMATNVLGVAENVAQATIGTVGNLFSGNIGGAISNAISGICGAVEESVPKLSTSGANGSFLAYGQKPFVIVRYRKQTETVNELFGRPLCKKRNISTLSGFVQVASPSVTLMGATDTERDVMNNALASGVYYE